MSKLAQDWHHALDKRRLKSAFRPEKEDGSGLIRLTSMRGAAIGGAIMTAIGSGLATLAVLAITGIIQNKERDLWIPFTVFSSILLGVGVPLSLWMEQFVLDPARRRWRLTRGWRFRPQVIEGDTHELGPGIIRYETRNTGGENNSTYKTCAAYLMLPQLGPLELACRGLSKRGGASLTVGYQEAFGTLAPYAQTIGCPVLDLTLGEPRSLNPASTHALQERLGLENRPKWTQLASAIHAIPSSGISAQFDGEYLRLAFPRRRPSNQIILGIAGAIGLASLIAFVAIAASIGGQAGPIGAVFVFTAILAIIPLAMWFSGDPRVISISQTELHTAWLRNGKPKGAKTHRLDDLTLVAENESAKNASLGLVDRHGLDVLVVNGISPEERHWLMETLRVALAASDSVGAR